MARGAVEETPSPTAAGRRDAVVYAAPPANRRRPLQLRRATTAPGTIEAAQAGRVFQLVASGLEGMPTKPSGPTVVRATTAAAEPLRIAQKPARNRPGRL